MATVADVGIGDGQSWCTCRDDLSTAGSRLLDDEDILADPVGNELRVCLRSPRDFSLTNLESHFEFGSRCLLRPRHFELSFCFRIPIWSD